MTKTRRRTARPNDFTAQEQEVLAAYYPEEGGDVFKRLPGRTRKSCQNKAMHMGLRYQPKSHPLGEAFMEAAKRPRGFSNAEMVQPGMTYKAVSTRSSQLVSEGKLFTTAKKGSQIKRYFDTQERCDAFYETYTPPNQSRKVAQRKTACIPGTLSPKPAPGGPARIPGEPDFSRAKWTIAPPPPAVLYRTNTFGG